MTITIRSLALLTSCIAWSSACSDAAPKSDKPTPPHVAITAKPEPVEPMEILTATAPQQPKSVADKLVEPKTLAHEESTYVGPVEFAHEEPEVDEAAELPNFDRAVKAEEVEVVRFELATGVDKHEPMGVTDTFDTDTKRIFAFVQLKNDKDPYAFEVHFEAVGGPKSLYGVKLQVPTAERYRTWAWTQIRRQPGTYRAVLRTAEGEEIASREFVIEPAITD